MDTIKPLFTATATATGGRNGHTQSSDGIVRADLSVPKAMGGPGKPGTATPEHLFAAGYDIKSESGLQVTIGQIDGAIGLEHVPVWHANDSKEPLGARVDRHEHIGKGKIGAEAFTRILRHPRLGSRGPEGLLGRAFLAETPIDDPGDDRRNVAALWELAGLQAEAPEAEKGFSMLTPALQRKISAERAQRTQRTKKKSPSRCVG